MKNRLSIASIFLLVFLAGGISGWFLRPLPDPPQPNMIEKGGRRLWSNGSATERTSKFLTEFDRELALSADQIEKIRAIIEPTMEKYIRFDKEHLRLRKVAHDEAVEAILPLLDPAQQEKLESLNQSSNQRFQRALKNIAAPD